MNLHRHIPPLAVLALAGSAGWAAARLCPACDLPLPGRPWLAAASLLLGLTCTGLGLASFRRVRTTITPFHPDAATTLVVAGIYRVTRNPMYLGFLAVLSAGLIWLANLAGFLAAPAFVLYLNRFQIGPEEQALRARFGSDYTRYAARVRRWL